MQLKNGCLSLASTRRKVARRVVASLTSRPRGRSILLAAPALVMALVLIAPGRSLAASGSITVHVSMSGGIHYTGTWRHLEGKKDFLCGIDSSGTYNVSFNDSLLTPIVNRKVKKFIFSFSLSNYRRSKTTYTIGSDIALFVGIPGRLYYNSDASFPPSKTTIRVGKNGLSGTVTGQNLSPYTGFKGHPISLRARWSCSSIIRSSMPRPGPSSGCARSSEEV